MEEKRKVDSQQKKPYVRPEVKKIVLTPEEAVLGFCKKSGTSGPLGSGTCAPSSINCSGQGS